MSQLTPEIVAQLKAAHGPELRAVHGRLHTIVFRKPKRGEYDHWRDQSIVDKAQQSRHDRELVKACRVWPEEDALNEVLDDQPAILGIECVNAIVAMAGLTEAISVEKL